MSKAVEILDPDTGEVTRPTALARVAPESTRVLALESLTEIDFARRLDLLTTAKRRLDLLREKLLVEGVDYGRVPGVARPTLYKPGAEKLCKFYGLVASFDARRVIGGPGEPPIRWDVTCEIHEGSVDGFVIAQGIGTASSWERKNRYRRGQRVCPSCKRTGTLRLTQKGTPKEGWWCPKDTGCSANFVKDDPAVVSQIVGDIENADPWDLDNTMAKMAKKRALVDATLIATATSGYFTQDVEDGTTDAHCVPAHMPGLNALEQGLLGAESETDLAAAEGRVRDAWSLLGQTERDVLVKAQRTARAALAWKTAFDAAARAAMQREPDPQPIQEPPSQAAQRAEIAVALSEPEPPREPGDDEPPPDEEAAMALIEPCRLARSTKTLATLWERVKATPSYSAATEGARLLAQKTIDAMREALMDEQRAAQKGSAA